MKTNIITILTAAFLAAAMLFSCASQSAPGGGPEDKDPPELLASVPESGQTNVDPRARITVTFSEWISTAGVSGAVAVYPPLAKGFDVRVAKNRLTVTPREPLDGNTTYHVVIGTSLRDLRNNAIPVPINVVFSTGAELDSGRIDGAVVQLTPLVAVPRVALYWYGDGDGWDDANYFAAPRYAAPVDSAGAFIFSNLREGRYRVTAFIDQFRIGRMRVGDPAFTSLEKIITVTKDAQTIRLYPTDSDTATTDPRARAGLPPDTIPPKLQSHLPAASASHLPTVRLAWTKPVRVSLSMVMAVEVRALERRAARDKPADIGVDVVADTVVDSGVDVVADTVVDSDVVADTVIDTDIDVAADTVVDTAVAVDAVPLDSVAFFFIPGDGHSDTTYLAPSRRLLPGKTYRFDIPVQAVRDANGIAAADSIVFTITTIPADSIAYRLHGGADCLEPDDRRKWVFRPTGRVERETFTVADRDGTFTFDSIPASKGTLMWFIDDNGDGRLTRGKLVPWRAPERFFIVPDTVEAKARWEVEDLRVRGCE
jgi:uncharacterized protein (DUF2141 family)